MKYIISGTNRKGSLTRKVSFYLQKVYQSFGETIEIIDLENLPLEKLNGDLYGQVLPPPFSDLQKKLLEADGFHLVCPEYNGSMPGALKLFIDYWKYPETFEHRPVAFIGLGGRFGGLRPVEHLQQIFGYRNSFIYPDRVFFMNVYKIFDGVEIKDEMLQKLLFQQVQGFQKFSLAIQQSGLHANQMKQK